MVGIANDLNINQLGIQSFNNVNGVFTGVTITGGIGITVTNGNGQSGNPTISLTGGSAAVEHLTGDSGGLLNPDGSNNFNLLGQQAGTIAVMDTIGSGSTLKVEDRSWLTPFVVDPSATVGLRGTFQTIQAAITAASSGQIIGIRSGTYTENLTLKAGVNFISLGDARQGETTSVQIIGKMIDNGVALNCSFTGILFTTNSDFIATLTAASDVIFSNCRINCTNNTGFSMSNASANIYMFNCDVDVQTTGIALYSITHGTLWGYNSTFGNSGSSTTTGTLSDGSIVFDNCQCDLKLGTSSTGILRLMYCLFGDQVSNSLNNTWVTTAGTGTSFAEFCMFYSGTASAVSVGAGTTLDMNHCLVTSSNTNAITGAGTINYGAIIFNGSSSTINTTTQVAKQLTTPQGGTQVVKVTLTSAQIKSLRASPITLVAAQGANTIIYPISIAAKFVYGGTNAFTNAGANDATIIVNYTSRTGPQAEIVNLMTQAAMTGTASLFSTDTGIYGQNAKAVGVLDNQLICVANVGANEYAGNAAADNTLIIEMFYYIATLT